MADKPAVQLSHEQLQELLAGVLAEANNRMNPLDRLKYEEEVHRLQRQEQFKALIAAEIAAQQERMAKCSHCRWPSSAGKIGGHAAPRGQGEWATGGQLHGEGRNKYASIVCLRCSTDWIFQPTDAEITYIEDQGMLGWAPPDESRLLKYCTFCSKPFPKKTVEKHEAECPAKFQPSPLKLAAQSGLEAR